MNNWKGRLVYHYFDDLETMVLEIVSLVYTLNGSVNGVVLFNSFDRINVFGYDIEIFIG